MPTAIFKNNIMTLRGKLFLILLLTIIGLIVFFIFKKDAPKEVLEIKENIPIETMTEEDKVMIKEVVTSFGNKLKNVSLTQEEEALKEAIKTEYGEFLSPLLLERFLNDPTHAPGKLVSSPWPERIEILDMYRSGDYYDVSGEIILWTSEEAVEGSGNAGKEPIFLTLVNMNGKWLIAEYQTSLE